MQTKYDIFKNCQIYTARAIHKKLYMSFYNSNSAMMSESNAEEMIDPRVAEHEKWKVNPKG